MSGSNTPTTNHTRAITAVAAATALALVLGYLKLYRLPQGGSITLETVPVLLLALWRGPRLGVLCGCLTGVLKLVLDPFVVHPVQILLDYPLPFALLGVAGIVQGHPRLGIILGSLGRWLSHVLAGAIFFAHYAPEGVSVWHYSVLYNLSYAGPEAAIAILLVPTLLRRVLTGTCRT